MPRQRVLISDYSWPDVDIEREVLGQAGAELVVAPACDCSTLRGLATGVDAIMTCWAPIPAEVIEAVENCRVVARLGIGLDNIDVAFCTRLGIPVTNVPDYCQVEVAEHTLALVLALARNIGVFHQDTRNGVYS
ncbi:MAG: C-terminal binding protein, partial [Pirellulaceae bacterium]